MKNAIIGFILATSLMACVTGGSQENLNRNSIGMTKQEVIAQMGPPSSTAAKEGIEYLTYELTDGTSGGAAAACAGAGVLTIGLVYSMPECRGGKEHDFFVRLVNGKVDSYGKRGDFDSTQVPEATINVNEKITVESEGSPQ